MKRFYKVVSVGEHSNGFSVELDGKPVKTPERETLLVPNRAIADELMREWMAQEEDIIPDSMPITQIATTLQDRIPKQRKAMEAAVLKYLDTDLICYRAGEPPELAQAQAEAWDEWTEWAAMEFGMPLKTTTALQAVTQDSVIHQKLAERVENMDDARFTILQIVVPLCGSVILGLAFVEGVNTADKVFAAATIEETHKAALYNEEKYGADPAQEKRFDSMKRDLGSAEKFLSLL